MTTPRHTAPARRPLQITIGDLADAANAAAPRMGVDPHTLGAFVASQTVSALRANRTDKVHPWAFITGDN